jgi:hypothetical protein
MHLCVIVLSIVTLNTDMKLIALVFFDGRVTNGYTSGMNLKHIKWSSVGKNVDWTRIKMEMEFEVIIKISWY